MSNHEYRPGDVANGHVLGTDNQWHPLPPPVTGEEKGMSTGLKVALGVVGGIFALGAIGSLSGPVEEPVESPAPEPKEFISHQEAVNQGICAAVAVEGSESPYLANYALDEVEAAIAAACPARMEYVTEIRAAEEAERQRIAAEQAAAEKAAAEEAAAAEPAPAPAPPSTYYANCSAARAAGAAPLYRGDPGYSSRMDRDGDGVACE